MAGLDKRVANYVDALDGLSDGMTVAAGGFGLFDIAHGAFALRERAPPAA